MPAPPSLDFSRAKSALSDVMTRVVHEHGPSVVSRRRGKERMLLVRADDLVRYLGAFRFEVEGVVDGAEVTLALPRLGLLGFGGTRDEALDDVSPGRFQAILRHQLRVSAEQFWRTPETRKPVDRGS